MACMWLWLRQPTHLYQITLTCGHVNTPLSLPCSVACSAGASLGPLLEDPPAGLKGLTVTGLTLKQERIEQLAGLTNLTSLHLVRATSSLVDELLTGSMHAAVVAPAIYRTCSCLTPVIQSHIGRAPQTSRTPRLWLAKLVAWKEVDCNDG